MTIIAIVAGDKQTIAITRTGYRLGSPIPDLGFAFFAPLRVLVTDDSGRPLAGQTVQWRVVLNPGGNLQPCHVSLGQAAGVVDNTVTDSSGASALDSLLNGQFKQLAKPDSPDPLSCAVYGTSGLAIIEVSCGGALVQFELFAGAPTETSGTAQASLAVIAGQGQVLTRRGADPVGTIFSFAPIEVLLKDKTGKPLAQQTVRWELVAAPAGAELDLGPAPASVTDVNGVATLADPHGFSCHARGAEGTFVVLANAGFATVAVKLTTGSMTMTIIEGNLQTSLRPADIVPEGVGATDKACFSRLVVKLCDATGAPMANQAVNFRAINCPDGMSADVAVVNYSEKTNHDELTAADGTAICDQVVSFFGFGTFNVTANFEYAVATFTLKTECWEGTITPVSGDGQKMARTDRPGIIVLGGEAIFSPLVVKVANSDGSPSAGVPVQWRVSGNTYMMAATVDCFLTNTDSNGMARQSSVMAWGLDGTLQVEASFFGVSTVFNLTVG